MSTAYPVYGTFRYGARRYRARRYPHSTITGNGAYTVSAVLWRADRYGTRIERIPLDMPLRGQIEFNEDTEAKHKLSLEVNRPGRLRPLVDYLIPEITLRDAAGNRQVASLGHYIVTPPKTELTSSMFTGTIEAQSIVWALAKDTLANGLVVPVGVDYGAAARDVVMGGDYRASQVALPDTGVLTTKEIPFPPGTSRLEVANTLYNSASYYGIWANGAGVITTAPYQDLSTARATHRYGPAHDVKIVGKLTETPEWGRLRNRVTVRNIAPGQAPIFATVDVANPDSPLHVDNFGLVLAETVDDPQVTTQEQADARAQALLSDGASYYRKASVETILDLSASAHDVVELDLAHAGARYDGLWVRRAWKVKLASVIATTSSELYRIEDWRA